jgi:hypothetical protein
MMDRQPGKTAVKVRLDPSLREFLEAAAAARGVSLNRELVDRLDRTRAVDSPEADAAASALAALFGVVIADVVRRERYEPIARERGWMSSPHVFDQVGQAVAAVLEAFRPEGPPPDLSATPWLRNAGRSDARETVCDVAAGRRPAHAWIAARLGDRLAEAVDGLDCDIRNPNPDAGR